jgi:bifunctional DNA-binding transcriptional regulator/antitoxin component of YhaV-PrlF toxin-antitoxin module
MPPPVAPTSKLVRTIRGGQITIPAPFRAALGITDDSLLRVSLVDGELRVRPVRVADVDSRPGSTWLRDLYRLFEPVRQETGRYPEESVLADIDTAIHEVRARRRPDA